LREKNKHKNEPKDYTLEHESMIRETWSGTTMAPLAYQSLLVLTQENASSNLRKRTSSLGLTLNFKVKFIEGCFGFVPEVS